MENRRIAALLALPDFFIVAFSGTGFVLNLFDIVAQDFACNFHIQLIRGELDKYERLTKEHKFVTC